MIKDRNVKENRRIRKIYCLGYDSMKIPAHLTFLSKDWFLTMYISQIISLNEMSTECAVFKHE